MSPTSRNRRVRLIQALTITLAASAVAVTSSWAKDARIDAAYKLEDEVVEAACGWSRSTEEPLYKKNEVAPSRLDTPDEKAARARKNYRYPDSYDHTKDPTWRQKALEAEHQLTNLRAEYWKKEGPKSRTAARLTTHINTVRAYLKKPPDSFTNAARALLWPKCTRCHKSDKVSIVSPPPNAPIEWYLKNGSFSCSRCYDNYDHNFNAPREAL